MKKILYLLLICLLPACGEKDSSEIQAEQIAKALKKQKIDLSQKVTLKDSSLIPELSSLKKISDSVMVEFGKGEPDKAFAILRKYVSWPESEFNHLRAQTVKQLSMLRPRFGALIGYEHVKTNQISKSLCKIEYLIKCENHALYAMFLFYKPKDKWSVNSFVWNDKVQLLK